MLKKIFYTKSQFLRRGLTVVLLVCLVSLVFAGRLLLNNEKNPNAICGEISAQANPDCVPREELPSGSPVQNVQCNQGLNSECRKFGINYALVAGVHDGAIVRADDLNMGYALMISQRVSDMNELSGVFNKLLDRGITPILRICLGTDQCDFHSADVYTTFLVDLSGRVGNRPFYALTGPNEPLGEPWNFGAIGDPAIGTPLAHYMNDVINLYAQKRGGSQVRLLTPAFNVTNPGEPAMIQYMKNAGANFGGVEGIAMNAYNTTSGDVTGYLNATKTWQIAPGKPYFITEFGMYDVSQGVNREQAKPRLQGTINQLKSDPEVRAALFFASFNTNTDPNFSYNHLNDDEFTYLLGAQCIEQAHCQ